MGQTKHTPGPWRVADHAPLVIYAPDGFAVASAAVFHGRHGDHGEAIANARLMAAAPDLLAALDACTAAMFPQADDAEWTAAYEAANAAIAKATGGEG